MSEFNIPNYVLTRNDFLDVVRNRIYTANFRNRENMGGICWPSNSRFDNRGRAQFFVGLNGNDPLPTQAVSLVHESIHIDIREEVNGRVVWGTTEKMKADEELFVQKQTSVFLGEHQRLAEGAVNYLKIKNGYGYQIPLKLGK